MKTEISVDRIKALEDLGFALQAGTPYPKESDGWYSITFPVKVTFKGREVYDKTYSLGVGHVSFDEPVRGTERLSGDEDAMYLAWKRTRSVNFVNKALRCRVAVKMAIAQKLQPKLDEVLHSLLADGECFFQARSFEDWAGDFGYDPDSRKAEVIYRECDSIGRRLAAAVPAEVLAQARTITEDI